MNAHRRAIADEVLTAARAHDAGRADRLARFRNVEPATAELLGVLVRATRARRVLELGTSNGYSTIWLADAVEATGGALTSVELDPARTALARADLGRAGLAAELVTGTRPRRCAHRTPGPGISSSSTPSGPPTPATGPGSCRRCGRTAACS